MTDQIPEMYRMFMMEGKKPKQKGFIIKIPITDYL